MPQFAFPAWRPDLSNLNNQASETIKNVVPNADGYGPFNDVSAFSDALGAACRGAKLMLDSTGAAHVMAGTATALYKLSSTAWSDVSGSSAPYNLADGDYWSFAQHEDNVIATNVNDPPQVFALLSDTTFSDLSGTPPQAKYAWTESGYLTLGNLASDSRKVRRSGYQDITAWTLGMNGSDQETLEDGGVVQGAAPDEYGAFVFQERKVRRMQNRPGEEVSFSLSEVDPTRGAISPFSIIPWGRNVDWVAEDGFYRLGNPSLPIGLEHVNRFFRDDCDLNRFYQIQGVADPIRTMSWWRYPSTVCPSEAYTDRLIGIHWYLPKWTYAEINLEWLLPAALPAVTLEEIESVYGYATLEEIPYSLDSRVWKGGRPTFAAIDSNHKLGFFEGATLEAILETSDIPVGGEGLRGYVTGFRPIGDVSGAYGSVGVKETLHGTPTFGSESAQNATGLVPLRASGRTVRARLRIPAGTTWNHISGIEIPREAVRSAGRR